MHISNYKDAFINNTEIFFDYEKEENHMRITATIHNNKLTEYWYSIYRFLFKSVYIYFLDNKMNTNFYVDDKMDAERTLQL